MLAAAAVQKQVAVLAAAAWHGQGTLPQVGEAGRVAVVADNQVSMQGLLFVDGEHERPQLRILLLRPAEFHAVEDAELQLVFLQALGQVHGVTGHDQLPLDARLRLHERAEGLHDHLHHHVRRIPEEAVHQADPDDVLSGRQVLLAGGWGAEQGQRGRSAGDSQ